MAEIKDKLCTNDGKSSAIIADLPRLKRPDRKKFTSELDRLNNEIKSKESQLKWTLAKSGPETLQNRLRQVRQEKEEAIDTRRKIGEHLLTVNKEITNKRDGLSRVHSTLKYKSEDWINEAIKRLEYQLRVHNFKLKEEKTIVKEIDSLNRSRRSLREYLARKAELDSIAKEQERMRNERDALFKKVTVLKVEEEKVLKELAEVRSVSDKLKQELDHLYRQKRNLVSEFRRETVEYNQQRVEQRKLLRKKTEGSQEVDDARDEVVEDKYLEETQLCDTLLTYLLRFESKMLSPSTCTSTPSCTSSLDTCDFSLSEVTTPVSPASKDETEEGVVLRKKEEGEWYCVGAKGGHGKRNLRRDKKKHLQLHKKKCITHTPETFCQFAKLGLKPPASIVEVPSSIEQLKAKKKYLQHLLSSSHEAASSSEQGAEFPLYAFAQNTSSSPEPETKDPVVDRDEEHTLPDNAEPVVLPPETEDSLVSTLHELQSDYKQKRTNFRLSLQICEPCISSEVLTNGSCESVSQTCGLPNGFGDKNGNLIGSEDEVDNVRVQPEVLILRKMDILSLPGPSHQLNMEVQ